jgi:hypothetical protein
MQRGSELAEHIALELAAVRALVADAQNEAATWQPHLSPIVDPLAQSVLKLADLFEALVKETHPS